MRVLDFGLAKAFGPADVTPAVAGLANSPTMSLAATQAGFILGTAADMSPEQAKGKPVDRRADIWSFGIVLFEMLSGQMVYTGETTSDTMAAVLMKEPDWTRPPNTTPPRLRELLQRCLVKDPRHRLQAIGEARIALDGVSGRPAIEVVDAIPAPARQRSWRTMATVAGLLVASALGATYAAWRLKTVAPQEVTRFTIPLPAGVEFSNSSRRVLSLSPDGRHLVYIADQKLYLHSFAAGTTRVIPGSESNDGKLHPVF